MPPRKRSARKRGRAVEGKVTKRVTFSTDPIRGVNRKVMGYLGKAVDWIPQEVYTPMTEAVGEVFGLPPGVGTVGGQLVRKRLVEAAGKHYTADPDLRRAAYRAGGDWANRRWRERQPREISPPATMDWSEDSWPPDGWMGGRAPSARSPEDMSSVRSEGYRHRPDVAMFDRPDSPPESMFWEMHTPSNRTVSSGRSTSVPSVASSWERAAVEAAEEEEARMDVRSASRASSYSTVRSGISEVAPMLGPLVNRRSALLDQILGPGIRRVGYQPRPSPRRRLPKHVRQAGDTPGAHRYRRWTGLDLKRRREIGRAEIQPDYVERPAPEARRAITPHRLMELASVNL